MSNLNIENLNKNLIPTYNRFPIVLDHGNGVYLYDIDGKEYIDFVSGIAVNSLGYNNPEVLEVINEQFKKLQHVSNLYYTEPLLKASARLAELTGLDEIFFTNSGAEAIECAIKLARRYQVLNKDKEATKIIAMEGSFHGRTIAAVTATGTPKYHENFGPMLPDVEHVPFNDFSKLEEMVGNGEDVAAIILEPIKGEGGIIPAEVEYLQNVKKLCINKDILLVFDEIQCGAARTGSFLAGDLYNIKPDILTLAKGIGAGFPVGACLTTTKIGKYLDFGSHGSTYGGNPLACAIVDFVTEKLSQPEFLESVSNRGEYLKEALTKLKEKYPNVIKDVRGIGLIQGLEFFEDPKDIINQSIDNGLLLVSAANNTIRFVPPLIISDEELQKGIDILDKVISSK